MGSEVKFTPEQQKVIDFRDNNLLVSAAAGSGKTTVMIQRVCDLIEKSQVPINKFLIISFTKASASDMKNKLIKKLSSIEPTPFILEQLDDILTSDVSNLHSFCARLLKAYFYEVGLDPTFIVLDQIDVDALKEKALQKLFNYKSEMMDKEFYDLIDIFSKSRKDKGLKEAVLKMHEFLCSIVDRDEWFRKTTSSLYNENLDQNSGAVLINSHMKAEKSRCEEKIRLMIDKLNKTGEKELVTYLQSIDSVFKLIRYDSSFYDNAKSLNLKERLPNMPKAQEGKEFLYQEVKDLKDHLMERFNKLMEYSCAEEIEDVSQNLKITRFRLEALYNLTIEFEKVFAGLKREKGGLDFNDLEEYTLKVLKETNAIEEIRNKYEYVFVDEYQDINGVQEEILTLLSKGNNSFMVGDVKQSIYRFRLCDPEIFLKKYNLYQEDKSKGELILLNANFRSKRGILEFVNEIFDATMTEEFGGVDYKGEARLNTGSDGQKDDETRVELLFADTSNLDLKQNLEIPVYSVKENATQSQSLEKQGHAEGILIASKIADLVAHYKIKDKDTGRMRKIKFSDITILTLSRTPFLTKITQTLESKGIPVSADVEGDCLEDEYVSGVKSFLEAVACYKVDYSLFGCLYSKLFNFSADELAQIKLSGCGSQFFYEDVLAAVNSGLLENNLQEKIERFFKILTIARQKASFISVKELARQIIEEQNLFVKISFEQDSEKRKQKLTKFLSSLNDQTVFEYLSENVLGEVKCDPVQTGSAVNVMTIHKSKGLEFGVVFLVGANRSFNFKTIYNNIVISKDFGVCLDYYDSVYRYKTPTLARQAVRLIETRKMLEEEQRLLYVALTRATDYLYVVGSGEFEEIKSEFPISPKCFLDFMGDLFKNPEAHRNINYNVTIADAMDLISSDIKPETRQVIIDEYDEFLIDGYKKIFEESYSYKNSIEVPMKTAVTTLASEDLESQSYEVIFNDEELSNAENGTLQHKVMQFIKLERKNTQELKNEIFELVERGVLTEEESSKVMYDGIVALINNQEFVDILSDAKVLKEREFYMNVSASTFNPNINKEDVVVVQGIVDLCVIKDNQITIIDYKTGKISNNQEKYAKQINLYAEAMEKAFNMKVNKKYIASIKTGALLEIK